MALEGRMVAKRRSLLFAALHYRSIKNCCLPPLSNAVWLRVVTHAAVGLKFVFTLAIDACPIMLGEIENDPGVRRFLRDSSSESPAWLKTDFFILNSERLGSS